MVSYAVHYELSRSQDTVLHQDFSRMRIETHREQPVLYVAMATWIPKCNMYHHQNNSTPEPQDVENRPNLILDQQDSTPKRKQTHKLSSKDEIENQGKSQHEPKSASVADIKISNVTDDAETPEDPETKEDALEMTQTSNPKEDCVEINKKTSDNQGDTTSETEKMEVSEPNSQDDDNSEDFVVLNDSDDKIEPSKEGSTSVRRNSLEITPKKVQSPKQVQKKLESEKKRQQRQKEKEEKERKKQEERDRIRQEKLKKKEEKQKELEQKQREKELKEEQKKKEREEKEELKKKEREEKEQKRKEKEEKEEQKRKEREQEKLKKQQEIEEKNKEKQKEVELKQKTAAAFVNFFVAKKSDNFQEEKKPKSTGSLPFMAFEVKSDMKLPPPRRQPLSDEEKQVLERYIDDQDETVSYIKDLKSGKIQVGKSSKTWPFEECVDDDVTIVEDEGNLGETICEDKSKLQKFRAKFLKFHENRRPAYFGTWRKKSSHVKPRKPFGTDEDVFNYEEDSDDDWEEEEQGESLNGSDDEADKENDDEKDDYEVDNEFFVPHGHLSEDEIDDEEKAKLSPESLKQKLKLLKDEFDQDMQLKTHKLKPRSIGCIWYNQDGSNVEEAIHRYLQPLAIISNGQILVKKRSEIFSDDSGKKAKSLKELNPEHIPLFLKVIHGNSNKKRVLIEQFMTYMANNGFTIDISKATLIKNLKLMARWGRCKENGPLKNKFCWLLNEDVVKKYNISLTSSSNPDSDSKK